MSEEEQLVERYRTGEESLFDQLVLNYLPLSRKIAFSFYRKIRKEKDEIEAEAYFILMDAIRKARTRLVDNNLGAYLNRFISRRILTFFYKTGLMTSSRLKEMKRQHVPLMHSLTSQIDPSKNYLTIDNSTQEEINLDEVIELIKFCIRTPLEEKVFKFKLAGYEDIEIATMLELPLHRIPTIRRNLKERFRKTLGEIECGKSNISAQQA